MKEKRILLLLLLVFISCSRENKTTSNNNWNNQITTKLNKTDSLIFKQAELKKNINFLLEFRKDIIKEIDKLKNKEAFSEFTVYENYNCEFNTKNTIQAEIPFTKNKFYYNILIISNKENYLYELKGFSEDKNFNIIKTYVYNKEDYIQFLDLENIGTKKTKYLLNDFSVTSKITCNGNDLNIEVISTRLN
ncbi:hypothetical protein [Flavobacterium sp.]|uniref:hypothetical protein n=1 Tax=Flavobacterium sp. TaxID=239 RepID=UPI004047F987